MQLVGGKNSGLAQTTNTINNLNQMEGVIFVAKEVVKKIKLQIPAGINIQDFCQKFNDASKDKMGDIVPCEITIYDDRSFDFILKTPPAPFLLKKVAKINKGSKKGANEIVATISKDELKSIAEIKMPDLNANDIEGAMNIIEGTARNMGIAIKGVNDAELQEQAKEAQKEEAEREKREEELEKMEAESKVETSAEVEVIGKENKESEEE